MRDQHPGGIRSTAYEYELAIARTEDLMVQAMSPKDIVATLITEGYTDSPDTVKKWRQEVQRRWANEEQAMRPARKDLWRARLESQYHAVLKRAAATKSDIAFSMLYTEATRIAKLSIVMDGLQAPVTIRSDGLIDPAAMSPPEREREIVALLARREAALTAKHGPGN
jgi:hypothetical protein